MATAAAISTLVLRVVALVLLAASVAIFAMNKYTMDGAKITFKDIQAYKYAVAAALIGFIYTLFQIPFALYHVITEKRLIRHGCLPVFDICADQIIAYILATAVGAGFGVTFQYKKVLKQFADLLLLLQADDVEQEKSKGEKFLDKGNLATGVLFLGFICVAVQAVISSITRNSNTSSRGGFFG